MSSANLELVRYMVEPWGEGHWGDTAWAHPDIEFIIADGVEPQRTVGIDGMVEAWTGFLKSWEDLSYVAEEIRELDDDRVLILTRNRGRGRASGVELDEMYAGGANLIEIEDGKVKRFTAYFDRQRAFADAGLSRGD